MVKNGNESSTSGGRSELTVVPEGGSVSGREREGYYR